MGMKLFLELKNLFADLASNLILGKTRCRIWPLFYRKK